MKHRHASTGRGLSRRDVLKSSAAAAGALLLTRPGFARAQGMPSEIRIGATIAQSGPLQGIAAPLGKMTQAWVDATNAKGGIFLKKYNKKLPLKLFQYDDKTDPPTARNFYERLATVDKVDLFIGPFSSGLNNATIEVAATHKIPYFIPEGNDSFLFKDSNPWRTSGLAPSGVEYGRLVELYKKVRGIERIAILARDNLHEAAEAKAFGDAMKAGGFDVVYNDIFPKDTKDFSSILLNIQQKNPDALAVECLVPPLTVAVLKQARDSGMKPKEVIMGHAPIGVIKGLGPAAENVVSMIYSFEGDTPDHKELNALCEAAGFEAWQYPESGIHYRTYRRVEDALERAGTLDHEAVREAMWSADFPLFGTERMKIDSTGYGTDQPYPVQVRGGKFVSLWPLEKGAATHKFKNGEWGG